MLSKKLQMYGIVTFSLISLQTSGGRKDADTAILDARDVLTASSCTLQDPLESLSLSECSNGPARRLFAGRLGRGCSDAPGGPSSASEVRKML